MMIVGVHIADIHFNPNNYKHIYHELNEVFLKKIKEYNKLDFISINGDLFDYEMSLNSPCSRTVINFIDELVQICIDKDIKLRILKGTTFHDNNQLRVFLKYEKHDTLDFKLIESVYSEELFPNFKVLYIPEEYMDDLNKYYREWFMQKYDMVLGHGMFKETSYVQTRQETGVTMKKAPIFDSEVFDNMSYGPIIFGHIHTPTVIKDKIYYLGSFSRLGFGEVENKGFSISVYDTIKKRYYVEFIHNNLTKKYDTIILNEIHKYDDIEKLIREIENKIVDNLRVIINYKHSNEQEKSNMEIIKNYFNKNKNVKILIKNININLIREQETKETEELKNLYYFLFDDGYNIEDKIYEFIKLNKEVIIDKEKIIKYLEI